MSTPARLARGLSRVALALLTAPLFAGQTVVQTSVPATAVPFTTAVTLPRFDPGAGFLRAVRLRCTADVQGSFGIENLATQSVTANGAPVALVTATFGIITTPAANPAYEGFVPLPLAAFDGTMDHGGASGTTQVFPWSSGTGAPSQEIVVMSAELLDAFRGASAPVTIDVRAWDASHFSSAPAKQLDLVTALEVRATIEITYEFDGTGAKFCGTGATWNPVGCPCGNVGSGSNGCANSVNAAGASLDATGNALLSGDTFELHAAGMGTGIALFVQSTDFHYPSVPYGDGARCFSGNLIRLGMSPAAGGAAVFPSAQQQPVSARGHVLSPTARYYTVYYRNTAPFCSTDMFNATNSIAAYWEP